MKTRMTQENRRKLAFGLALALILALSAYLALNREGVREAFQNLTFLFQEEFDLGGIERVLVIAPHTDDEILGAGGAIQRHLARGARVVVVILTNGDGQYRRLIPSRQASINLGYTRQKESLAALAHLGLAQENVIFLGYPDRGLSDLWNSYWDCEKLYSSRYTKTDRSPYRESFTAEAPYCGFSIVADLMKILEQEKPQLIYVPHPNDLHPDHQAAWAFTVYAVEQSGLEPELLAYIIHRERWPEPQGLRVAELLFPPPSLSALDTEWHRLDLEPEEREKKFEAIQQFHSQTKFIEDYLVSFARANELFGLVPVLETHSSLEIVEPEAELEAEAEGERLMANPLISYLDPPRQGASDIRTVTLDRAGEMISIGVEFSFGPLVYDEIKVHLKPLGPSLEKTFSFLERRGELYLNGERFVDEGVSFERGKREFSLTLPLDLLGRPEKLILGVEISRRGTSLERSAYRLIKLE